MKVRVLTVSHRQPDWVVAGHDDYARRLPREWAFELVEIRPEPRSGNGLEERVRAAEAKRLTAALPKQALVVALDERGASWSTAQFAERLQRFQAAGRDLAFVIGGADGLDEQFRAAAAERLSLSALTLPHGLVRVVLVEQLYRAAMLAKGHPYHR